jgi:hypothetical protein
MDRHCGISYRCNVGRPGLGRGSQSDLKAIGIAVDRGGRTQFLMRMRTLCRRPCAGRSGGWVSEPAVGRSGDRHRCDSWPAILSVTVADGWCQGVLPGAHVDARAPVVPRRQSASRRDPSPAAAGKIRVAASRQARTLRRGLAFVPTRRRPNTAMALPPLRGTGLRQRPRASAPVVPSSHFSSRCARGAVGTSACNCGVAPRSRTGVQRLNGLGILQRSGAALKRQPASLKPVAGSATAYRRLPRLPVHPAP